MKYMKVVNDKRIIQFEVWNDGMLKWKDWSCVFNIGNMSEKDVGIISTFNCANYLGSSKIFRLYIKFDNVCKMWDNLEIWGRSD